MSDKPVDGDTKVILHRLDQVSVLIGEVKTKQDDFHEDDLKSKSEIEKQTALLQQSHETICKQVDQNSQEIKEHKEKTAEALKSGDRWNKVIAGLITFIIAVGTAAVAYMTTLFQRATNLMR